MPVILPSAALLVVLTRPGAVNPPSQAPAQTEPADKTKNNDQDKDAKAPKAEK